MKIDFSFCFLTKSLKCFSLLYQTLSSWQVTMATSTPACPRIRSCVRSPGWGRSSPTVRPNGSRRCSSSHSTRRWRRVRRWRGAPGWARRLSGWVRRHDALWGRCGLRLRQLRKSSPRSILRMTQIKSNYCLTSYNSYLCWLGYFWQRLC